MTNPPQGNVRAQRRRAEILQAVHLVFTSRGLRNGSLGEIAERVGEAVIAHLLATVTLNTRRSAIVQDSAVLSAESVTRGYPAQAWFRDRFAASRTEVADPL